MFRSFVSNASRTALRHYSSSITRNAAGSGVVTQVIGAVVDVRVSLRSLKCNLYCV